MPTMVDAFAALVEAAEAVATGPCFCPGANNGPCRRCRMRTAFDVWKRRARLYEDNGLRAMLHDTIPIGDGHLTQLLDYLDGQLAGQR